MSPQITKATFQDQRRVDRPASSGGRGMGRLRDAISHPWQWHHLLIFRKSLEQGAYGNSWVTELGDDPSRIRDCYRELGRDMPPWRIEARLARGLRFYEMREAGRTVASTWLVLPGQRFVDEVGYALPVTADSLWVRDIFVAEDRRGQGCFARLLDGAVRHHPKARTLWSDTKASNDSSVRAHERAQFRLAGTLWAMHIMKTLMLRGGVPPIMRPAAGYRSAHRLLATGDSFDRFVQEHVI